jgi:hypothetical protein
MKTFSSFNRTVLTFTAALAGISISSSAAVIYDEAVGGDLPGDQNFPLPIGKFSAGVNSVLGTAFIGDGGGGQGDTFGLELMAGQAITSIKLSIFNDTTIPGNISLTTFRFPFLNVRQQTGTQGSSVYTFTPIATQPLGFYGFSEQFIRQDNGSFQYRWDITVTDNSIPDVGSSLVMLGLAFAGCAGLKKRLVS